MPKSREPDEGAKREALARLLRAGATDSVLAGLSEANLAEANLAGAKLAGANLRKANLSNADLSNADLSKANLVEADLGKAILGDADIRGADLRAAILVAANLAGADLAGANLSGANLEEAILSEAQLGGAKLASASLTEAELSGADLSHADLRNADLGGAQLEWANLSMAALGGVNLAEAYLERANLVGANLEVAEIWDAKLIEANLSRANLDGVDLRASDLSGANLTSANLTDADLTATVLTDANLGGADLTDATLVDVTLPASACDADRLLGAYVDWRTVARSLLATDLQSTLVRTGMPDVAALYLIDSLRTLDAMDLLTMLQSVFLSYGGPDEAFAVRLRETLTANGVKTWFYPRNAVPGRRHHRHLQAKIHAYDRMILCCSAASLQREGVLHEVEEVLEREQDEGGSEVMIPVLLQPIFDTGKTPPSWWPAGKEHIYLALRRRVGADFVGAMNDESKWNEQIGRLLEALRKRPDRS